MRSSNEHDFEEATGLSIEKARKQTLEKLGDDLIHLVHSLLTTRASFKDPVHARFLQRNFLVLSTEAFPRCMRTVATIRELWTGPIPATVRAVEEVLHSLRDGELNDTKLSAATWGRRTVLQKCDELICLAIGFVAIPSFEHATLLHLRLVVAREFKDVELFETIKKEGDDLAVSSAKVARAYRDRLDLEEATGDLHGLHGSDGGCARELLLRICSSTASEEDRLATVPLLAGRAALMFGLSKGDPRLASAGCKALAKSPRPLLTDLMAIDDLLTAHLLGHPEALELCDAGDLGRFAAALRGRVTDRGLLAALSRAENRSNVAVSSVN